MSLATIVKGLIRGEGDQERRVEVSRKGDLFVAQGALPYTDLARRGNGYGTMATDAVAGLVVRPTTVAALEIFNNMEVKSLVIARIFSQWLVTTAVVESAVLYAMVTLPKAAPTDAALAICSLSGKPATTRHVLTAAGTTVVANGWLPWGESFSKAAGGVVPHGGLNAPIDGHLIVPPKCSLCIHVLASLVGDTFTSGAIWYEEELALE